MPFRSLPVIKLLIVSVLLAPVIAGCTTATPDVLENRPIVGSAEQLRQHHIKQQRRFEAGNYKRITREKQCRLPAPAC